MVEAVDSFAPVHSPFRLPVYPTASPHVVLIRLLPLAQPFGPPVYPTASPHVVLIRSLPLTQPFGPPVYPTASPHVVFSLWIKPWIPRILDWGAHASRVLV